MRYYVITLRTSMYYEIPSHNSKMVSLDYEIKVRIMRYNVIFTR